MLGHSYEYVDAEILSELVKHTGVEGGVVDYIQIAEWTRSRLDLG